jgi:hypothetical protein
MLSHLTHSQFRLVNVASAAASENGSLIENNPSSPQNNDHDPIDGNQCSPTNAERYKLIHLIIACCLILPLISDSILLFAAIPIKSMTNPLTTTTPFQ